MAGNVCNVCNVCNICNVCDVCGVVALCTAAATHPSARPPASRQIKDTLHANWRTIYSSFDYYAVITTTSGAEDRYDIFNINLNAYTRCTARTSHAQLTNTPPCHCSFARECHDFSRSR